MEQTLAEKHPETVKRLERNGFVYMAKMFRRVERVTQLDRMLGTTGAASKWARGDYLPNATSEQRARIAYEKLDPDHRAPVKQLSLGLPEIDFNPETTFLVIAPRDKADKVEKVLALMGCEAVQL